MKVIVKLFASYKELTGKNEILVTLDKNATVETLLDVLFTEYPQLKTHKEMVTIARNKKFVKLTEPLNDNDEVALLPPVSGG